VGDTVSGEALPVADPRLETVEFYKVSHLKNTVREVVEEGSIPSIEFLRSTRTDRVFAARTCPEGRVNGLRGDLSFPLPS
jgi:hypothetical protein